MTASDMLFDSRCGLR